MTTPAERKRAERQRKRDSGLVKVEVWIPPTGKGEVKALEKRLREEWEEIMEQVPEGWKITYDPKPIPSRAYDYDFVHEDYDGALDGNNGLCGSAGSVEQAIKEIRLIMLSDSYFEQLDNLCGECWIEKGNPICSCP